MDWEMGLKGKLLCPFDTILTVPSLHLVFLRREGEVGGVGGVQRGCKERGTHFHVPLCKLFAAYTAKSVLHLFHLL